MGVFPQDRLVDAIARYEQHVRDVTGGTSGTDHGGPTNRADRLQRARLGAGDEQITMIQTLAVRDDHLALHYVDAGEPRLEVTEWDDDDRFADLVTYSPNHLADALADLDERYMLRLDPVGAARVALGGHFWRAFRRGNLDEQARSTDISDRRSLGWGPQHTMDDRVQSTADDLAWTDQIHTLGDGIACTSRTTVRGGLGSVLVQRQVSIIDHMATDSRRTQAEIFDVDDLDVALARRQQLIDERADRPVPNDAFIVDDTADSVAHDLPLDRFLTLLDPDFEATLADGRTIKHPDLEAGRATPADLGYGTGTRNLFATRVDDVAMIEITGEDGTASWVVLETHDRLLTGLSVFDERHDAGMSLDRTTARSEAAAYASVRTRSMNTFSRCLMNSDADGAIGMLAPDFIMVDHRPIGLGTMDNEAYAASIRSAMSLGSTTFTRSLRLRDGTALSVSRNYYPGAGSGLDYVDTATVVVGDEAHVMRIEHFDPGDLAATVTRFNELADDGAT